MNKPADRIYINQWLELKPYEKQVATDRYYLKLCNKVKQAIATNKQSAGLQIYLGKKEMNILTCFLTSYFEDIISETNLWNTFVKHHVELYHKPLPFFKTEEYYEDEIDLQDVRFLIWYFLNTFQQEKFTAPFNHFITETAEKVMDVFDAAWDYAPENKALKPFYSISENETDFYRSRNLINNILFESYLFFPDTLLDLRSNEMNIIEENRDDENLISFLNELRDDAIHNAHTRLLGFYGKEWASKIVGENHPLHNDFQTISPKIRGLFFYKGQNDKDVFLKHIASGKKFNLTKKSFDHYEKLKKVDTILNIGIVQWRNEWWFSGLYFPMEFNADLVLDEKNSLESRMAVNFLDFRKQNVDELLAKQLKAFKDFTNGAQIVFMKSDKIDDFIRKYTDYFNDSLKLSKKERKKAIKKARADGFFGEPDKSHDYSDISESGLVFFNPKSGAEVALGINSAFPLPNNPFFNENESEDHIMSLLMDEDFSKELVMYCINNSKSKLPFFKESTAKMYLENFDFLLRFWKKDSYFAKPSITYTGTSNK